MSDSTTTTTTMNTPVVRSGGVFAKKSGNDLYIFGRPDVEDVSSDTVVAEGSTEHRALADRFSDIVNVKDFGAVGDGETDDATAIQNAINAGSGKIVFFPSGTYIISENLTVNQSDITLLGEGKTASVIKRKANSAADVGGITVGNCSDVSIRSMGFDGNRANQTTKCVGVEFLSDGGGVDGVFLQGVASHGWGKASGNYGLENFSAGVVLYNAKKVFVTNCLFYDNAHYGLSFFQCEDVLVKSCISEKNIGHGYGCANTTRMNFVGNAAADNATDGIWFRNLNNAVIGENTIEVACQSQLEVPVQTAINGIIIAGRANEPDDLPAGQLCDVVVSGNVISCDKTSAFDDVELRGITVHSETSVRVRNVRVSNNIVVGADQGIRAVNIEFSSVVGNTIKESYLYGIYASGINMCCCSENNIFNCKQHGIYLLSRYSIINNNRISSVELNKNNFYYGIHLDGVKNNFVSKNYIVCGDVYTTAADANKFLYGIYLSNTYYSENIVVENAYLSSPANACVGCVSGYDTLSENIVDLNWNSQETMKTVNNGEFFVRNPYKTGASGITLTAKSDSDHHYMHGLFSRDRHKWMVYSRGDEDGVFIYGSPSLDDNSDRIPTTWWVNQRLATLEARITALES